MDTHTAVSHRPLQSLRPVELMTMGALIDPAKEAVRLELILTPATEEQRLQTITNLFKQFAVPVESDPAARREQLLGYLLATEGYPFWAIIETGKAFIQGKVEGHNTEFMPKAPTIGRELANRVDDYRAKLGRARKAADELQYLEGEHHSPRSEALKAIGDKRVAELRALADEDRRLRAGAREVVPEWTDPAPLTAEMLADVPDAEPRKTTMQKAPIPDSFKNLKRTA